MSTHYGQWRQLATAAALKDGRFRLLIGKRYRHGNNNQQLLLPLFYIPNTHSLSGYGFDCC